MIILTIRTDREDAEVGLYDNQRQLVYKVWPAHRHLAESLHITIRQILESQDKHWNDIEGIVCYKGPGSFTGLRIGLSVGNALSFGLGVPVVADNSAHWLDCGLKRLIAGENETITLPEYYSDAHITRPK